MSAKNKTAACFLAYLAGIILVTAIASPWAYWSARAIVGAVFPSALEDLTFNRVFNRVILVVAVAGIWPLCRFVAISSTEQIGWVRHPAWWRHLTTGFIVGIGSFGCALILTLLLGDDDLTFNRSPVSVLVATGRYLIVGCVVALIEETYFRGGIQRVIQLGSGNVFWALVLSSAIYSGVHFMKLKWQEPVTWHSGFDYAGAVMSMPFRVTTVDQPAEPDRPRMRASQLQQQQQRAYRPNTVAARFVTLFLAGCVMGVAFHRTGMLYLPVGLHAGWVLANELCRWSTKGQGFVQIRDRWETWPVLIVLLLCVARMARPPDPLVPSATGDPSSS